MRTEKVAAKESKEREVREEISRRSRSKDSDVFLASFAAFPVRALRFRASHNWVITNLDVATHAKKPINAKFAKKSRKDRKEKLLAPKNFTAKESKEREDREVRTWTFS